jgi:hypothetical protein
MSILAALLIVVCYFLLRQVWFGARKIPHVALIDRIELCTIAPDVFLTEVEVTYKYYFGGGVYHGKGYVHLFDFLGSGDYRLSFSPEMVPIFQFQDKVFVTEEHIESFLLSLVDTVNIYIDPIEPFRSKMIDLHINSLGAQKTDGRI